MPGSIDSKTELNLEMGFLCLQLKFLVENYTQMRNMKKNVGFTAMLFCKFVLITHHAL